jgi:hypothetical protein
LRALIPAIVYRLNRCSAADIQVLINFITKVSGIDNCKTYMSLTQFGGNLKQVADQPDPAAFSAVLNFNIVESERWLAPGENAPNPQTVQVIMLSS